MITYLINLEKKKGKISALHSSLLVLKSKT
jgi:hypothetical protein